MTVHELVQELLEYNPDMKILVAGTQYEEKGLTEPVLRFLDEDDSGELVLEIS